MNPSERILVCAPSNSAVENLADQMQKLPFLSSEYVKLESMQKEDIFNLNTDNLKPYSMLYKILHMPEDE